MLFSFAWPLILIGLLRDKESAVTWSVAGRIIHNSYWPTVLRTDATASTGVCGRVVAISYVVILASVLASIAAVVTPLGLYEDIGPSKNPTPVQFVYAQDKSALGLGTPPRRKDLGFSRICGGFSLPIVCPHSENNLTTYGNATVGTVDAPDGYDTRIPKNVYEFFQSGLSRFNRSVSSLFDIQYRVYSVEQDTRHNFVQNGSRYLTGNYRQITNIVLNDDYEAVEGLVVDTKKGGIGFRNHTIPAEPLQYGGQWTEDITFIEPVTECANMNLTLDFAIPANSGSSGVEDVALVDHGGFVDLNRTYPLYDIGHAQDDPELAFRAYKGAWTSNTWTMLYLNITNPGVNISGQKAFSYLTSEKGKQYLLPVSNSSNTTSSIGPDGLVTGTFLSFVQLPSRDVYNSSEISNSSTNFLKNLPPNPWRITKTNFTEVRSLCKGAMGGDKANITNVAGECGFVMAIPRRTDGIESVLFEPGTKWTTPLYNCASASRAIIKSVTFSMNGTAALNNLKVVDISEKKYPNSESYPIWAVENTSERLSSAVPLWGLAEKEEAPFGNISFKRSPHLWLAGYDTSFVLGTPQADSQNLPGLSFHSMALSVAYAIQSGRTPDYTGATSLPMYNRWKELTKTSAGTATLINLIWTDIAANAVIGTRGQMPSTPPPGLSKSIPTVSKRATGDASSGPYFVPITKYARTVKYRYVYAIPAFIVLAIVLAALVLLFASLVFRRATPARMRAFLTRLSAGRLMTSMLTRDSEYAYASNEAAKKQKWLESMGRTQIDVADRMPRLADGALLATRSQGRVIAGMGDSPMSSMLERKVSSPAIK